MTDPKNFCKIFSDIPDGVIIGKNVKIGRLCHIDPDVRIGDNTNIQGGVYIPPETVIMHNVFVGPCVVFTNDKYPPSGKLTNTTVMWDVVICANATIAPGITIGHGAVIGMGAVVTKDVLPNSVVFGNPATFRMSRKEYDQKQREYTGDTGRSGQLGKQPQEDSHTDGGSGGNS